MKHRLAKLFVLFLVACLALTACAGDSKTIPYTCQDLTLEIPESCTEIPADVAKNFAFAFSNSSISIMGLREKKDDLPGGHDMTLEEYAGLIQAPAESEITTSTYGDRILVEYENNVKGLIREKTFKYLASVYETEEAFWLIQCACMEKDYEANRETFLSLLTSVTG